MDLSGSTIKPAEMAMEMRESFLAYAMSVIVARALPDVRDGLKPVHRRILYAMHESGITPNRPHKKSAWTVGEVIGKYHPHGDVAVYDTMVRLAQDFSMRVPLVDGHGNFGSVDGDGAAAMRYTEARLQKSAMELLRDLEKETVDFQPNYDESLQEPTVLPARFPNLLVNGSAGIAVGMATNIPPHNLGEVIDATTLMLDNPDVSLDELMQVIPGPDFPSGAMVMGAGGIRDYFETGRGSLTLRAKARLEKTSTGRDRIVFYEMPYMMNKNKLEIKINELMSDKKLVEVSLARDESDRNGIRFVVELKNGVVPDVVLNKLYKHTSLQTSFGVIMLSLVDGVPRTLGLREVLHYYILHQLEVIVRRTRFDLKKAEDRAHILKGLIIALDNIDEVIAIIKAARDDAEARAKLMARFGLTQTQTDAILEMRLRRLTGLEREKIDNELAELVEKIAYFQKILADEQLQRQVIKEELAEVRGRFANKRRTELAREAKDLEIEDLIADEDMVVTITRSGYVKRLPVATYRQQKRGGKGLQGVNLKDDDFVEHLFVASTHDYMMFFSTRGKVYRLKVHELPVGSRHARGTAIVNLLPLESGETIASVINTRAFPEDEYLLFATAAGMTKKTALSAYRNSRRDGLIAIKLRDDDELIAVRRVKTDDRVVMVSSGGKAIVWDESEARPMGRDTSGVQGMRTPADELVIGMEIAPPATDAGLFVVTVGGYGKRTPLSEYPLQHRGGQGVFTIKMTEAKGKLAAMKVVGEGHELMLVSEEGVMIRVRATDISEQGRPTQGVKVMNVSGTDRVTAVARVAAAKQRDNSAAQSVDIGSGETLPGLDDDAAADDVVADDGDAAGGGAAEVDAAGEGAGEMLEAATDADEPAGADGVAGA
ncbi:MAG: DNA gyrase subunit A [Coriobacteriales bacterium]|jgi:DNA gyrase subunit A|nr:DNA gyrase subunit A [Coriobacteriales bacterium]